MLLVLNSARNVASTFLKMSDHRVFFLFIGVVPNNFSSLVNSIPA